METLSRVKRYEDLRKQIEDDSIGTDTLPAEQLQDYAQRLNELDPSIFKKVTISEEEPNTPQRERKVTMEYDNDNTMGEFRNEYLDDFINEVREYNIKKGNRESENTQIDILNKLNAVSRAKRADFIEKIADDVQEISDTGSLTINREEIAAQVKSLVAEETTPYSEKETLMVEPVVAEETDDMVVVKAEAEPDHHIDVAQLQQSAEAETMKMKKVRNSTNMQSITIPKEEKRHPFINRKGKPTPVMTKEEQAEVEREKRLHQKLVEETQQLRVQLNEYEDDLNDLSEGVEKTNKMLNIILGCLILALLVIIGIVIYWIVQAGGMV